MHRSKNWWANSTLYANKKVMWSILRSFRKQTFRVKNIGHILKLFNILYLYTTIYFRVFYFVLFIEVSISLYKFNIKNETY